MIIKIGRDIDKRFYNVYQKSKKDDLYYMFTMFEDDLADLVGEESYGEIVTDTDGGFATLKLTAEVV